jgi:hypothetical protein
MTILRVLFAESLQPFGFGQDWRSTMSRKSWYCFLAFAVATAALFVQAGHASAQVINYSAYNPWTGKIVQRVEGYNPYIGQFGQGSSYYNPYNGAYGLSGVGYDPFTGTYTGTVDRYNPYLGWTFIRQRAFNPYTGQYGWRNYALPGRW